MVTPAFAAADSGEDAFAQAVLSCLARHPGTRLPDTLPKARLSPAVPSDPAIAEVIEHHGPTLKVASDTGAIYLTEEPGRCEVRGVDIEPLAAARALERRLTRAPYSGRSPLGVGIVEMENALFAGWLVKTRPGVLMVAAARQKKDAPRTLFASVTRY